MIFEELVLHNFGVYQERQVCKLATTTSKPVVLVGGLNGAGKSTFMDAIQLALYGKRARCSNRGRLSYDAYLTRCIHKAGRPSDGAGIELQFRYRSEGEDKTYRVNRYWTVHDGSVKERVDILRSGVHNQVATDSWDDHIESIIPIALSELFFFDGEHIEALADLDRSTDFLRTALHGLLGLHLVNSLESDLSVVERRKRREEMPRQQRDAVDDLTAQLKQLTSDRATVVQEAEEATAALATLQKQLEEVERQFEREGGHLLDQRTQLEVGRDQAATEATQLEDDLCRLATGPAPLLLVRDLLESIHQQDVEEQRGAASVTLRKVLEQRDQALLSEMEGWGASRKLRDDVRTYLQDDRTGRSVGPTQPPYLGLNDDARLLLDELLSGELEHAQASLRKALDDAMSAQERVSEATQALGQVPDEDAIAELVSRRHEAAGAVKSQEHKVCTLTEAVDGLQRQIRTLTERRTREEQRTARRLLESKDAGRVITYSSKARAALVNFRSRIIQSHVTRIERLILQSFKDLLRKRSLVVGLRIDPHTFELSLTGSNGRALPADRLSAGERQLLAVAILWGLRRASSRPLPVVIDTPLGRLDSTHRSQIVKRYFPEVSQQVILLSTDEEIDRAHHQLLSKSISHQHLLTFNETAQATTITPGYFW